MHAKAAKEQAGKWREEKKTQVNNSRHINVVRNIPSRSTSGEAKGCIKVMLDEGHVGLNESQ